MDDTRVPGSPLEVLLEVMRLRWSEGKHDAAAGMAKLAAPYLHPRAARPAAAVVRPAGELTDAELAAELAALGEPIGDDDYGDGFDDDGLDADPDDDDAAWDDPR